jgi:hypothetical protein
MSYTFAGTSVLKGVLKVRFANSEARAKQLAKLGDTDVNIVPLPSAMDKAGAVAYLLGLAGFADTDAVREALQAEVAVKTRPAKAAKIVKKKISKTVTVKARPTMDSIRAKAARARAAAAEVTVTEAEVDSLMMAVFGTK